MPDVLMIDNPDLQEVAATGALAPLSDYGVDLTGLYANLLDAHLGVDRKRTAFDSFN